MFNINQIIQPMTEAQMNSQRYFICLPRQSNLGYKSSTGAIEGICPVCDNAVYVSNFAQNAISKGHIGVCTMCAISGKAEKWLREKEDN